MKLGMGFLYLLTNCGSQIVARRAQSDGKREENLKRQTYPRRLCIRYPSILHREYIYIFITYLPRSLYIFQ